MHSDVVTTIVDLPYDEYEARQRYEISEERLRENVSRVRAANHFSLEDNGWTPLEYEGAAIVSMLDSKSENSILESRLLEIRNDLALQLEPADGFYFLPKESFHQTIANLLSEERFQKNIADASLEQRYPQLVKDALDLVDEPTKKEPIKMRMTGLSLMGTAIGLLGVFENKNDYQRIIDFRSTVYDNNQLQALDIRRTRPFIGHVTVAYIEHELNARQKYHLATTLSEINNDLEKEENYFYIGSAEFRRYHHLAEFTWQDHYPAFAI